MKKICLALALIGSTMVVHAQNSNVTSAIRHLEDYMQDKDSNDLKDAKNYIDQATVNDKTMNEPKTWLTRGRVYATLYSTQVSQYQATIMKSGTNKLDASAIQDAHVKAIAMSDTTNIAIAVSAFAKSIQIDPKSDYADDSKQGLLAAGNDMLNKAIVDKNNQKYGSALVFFQRVAKGMKASGFPDTGKQYKQLLQSAAFCAEKTQNYPKAIEIYTDMTTIKGGSYSYGAIPYTELYKLYINKSDTTSALNIVSQGRAACPDDLDLLNDETNGYLWKNQGDKAAANLQTAVDKLNKKGTLTADETNLLSRLYFILGTIYDNQANPRDAQRKLIAKPANFNDLFTKADTNYKMAFHAMNTFYEPYLNLGAMYLNRIQVIYDTINAMTDKNPKANTKKQDEEAKLYLYRAEPFLEKAHALKPDDREVKSALLKLYANTGQEDKAKALTTEK